MRYRELKVGMNIIGKPNNGYAVTNQYATCKVLKVNGLDEIIFVEVIHSDRPQDIGTRWPVDYRMFVKANVDMPVNTAQAPTNKKLTFLEDDDYEGEPYEDVVDDYDGWDDEEDY